MNDTTIPPLPPGFELEPAPVASGADSRMPPLPPGFVLEAPEDEGPGLEIEIRGGTPVAAENFDPYAPVPEQAPAAEAKPSLFRADSDFQERAGVGAGNMLWAAAKDMFGSDQGVAEYLAQQSGGTVQKGANGELLVSLPDGTSYRINDAGLDSTDVAKLSGNVLAFLTPAGYAARIGQARNLGLAGRVALQSGAAGATDAALQASFDNGRIDPVRTAAATAGGGLGEVVGTGLAAAGTRVVNALRGATGANKEAARTMLKEAGVARTTENVNALARAQNELAAGANPNALLGRQEFGLTYTQGQRALDPVQKFRLQSQEEVLRQSPGGGAPLREAERRNTERVSEALAGIGQRLGGRAGATPAELAQGAAGRLRDQADELGAQVSQAYEKAGRGARAAISSDSIRALPDRLTGSVAEFSPNATLTPATAKTLEQVRQATQSILAGTDGANVRGVTLKALETQRRILNNNIGAAANRTDKAAMSAVKREFDQWLDEAVDGALVSGDPAALTALKEARGLRTEFAKRFEGRAEADKFITGLLDGSRTPEELVNIALGAGQVSKAAGARFVQRLKDAAQNDPEVIGPLRAAHFLRMTQSTNGENVSLGQLVRNIRSTEYTNSSVMKALYSPDEWKEIRRLASALEPLVQKGDFARTSGTSERLARMLFSKFGDFPVVGGVFNTVGGIRDAIRANRALNQPLRLPSRAHPAYPAVIAPATSEAID